MPSTPLTGSFASAAAGTGIDPSTRPSRPDGNGHNEWSRRQNGPTPPFRRSLTAQSNNMLQRETSAAIPGPNSTSTAYFPRHLRYSRSQLLDLFRQQRETGDLTDGLADLLVEDRLEDRTEDGTNGKPSAKWNRRDEHRQEQASGPELCWDRNGATEPLGLYDMTDEEREIFSTSVNSPLKGPQQQGFRDTTQRDGVPGRKASISQNQPMHGLSSQVPTRLRRRDTSESYPLTRDDLASPSVAAFPEEALDFGSFRRRPTLREAEEQVPDQQEKHLSSQPARTTLGSLGLTSNHPMSPGRNGPSSPWPSSSSGAFGNLRVGGASEHSSANKRPELGAPRESRYLNLMTKKSIDEDSNHESDDRGMGGLGKVDEDDRSRDSGQGFGLAQGSSERGTFGHGSAVLGGRFEDSTQSRSRYPAFGAPSRKQTREEAGLGSRGGLSDQQQQLYEGSNIDYPSQDENVPMSPTNTNPYGSPQQRMSQMRHGDSDDQDFSNAQLSGLGNFRQDAAREAFASNRAPSFQLDRGQGGPPNSARGFPSLVGLGADPRDSGSRMSTPSWDRSAFTEHVDPTTLVSPAMRASGPPGPIGRGSRLGAILPSSQQDDNAQNSEPEGYEDMSRGIRRDTNSPFHGHRGKYDDFLGSTEGSQGLREDDQDDGTTPFQPFSPAPGQGLSHQSSFQQQGGSQRSAPGSSGMGQPPAAQQKTMVMPDRIRWVYLDPQGERRGPFSGLRMHDWYRGGFFSPELLVKKLEDPDYEPLAQLIRRIGNSREPFLVPQIGIPHATSAQGSQWPSQNPVSTPTAVGSSAQPPFAGSFPSFGTTLTADQQNALERRKQEEQYLMARQKEHLAQQQVLARHMQGQHGLLPQPLQHQSSAQSLSSQPSFGSITSPVGYLGPAPGSNQVGQAPGLFEAQRVGARVGAIGTGLDNLGQIREEDASSVFERLNLGRQPDRSDGMPPIGHDGFEESVYDERTAQALNDRARLRHEQAEADSRRNFQDEHESQQDNNRLREFNDLRAQQAKEGGQLGDFDDGYARQQTEPVGKRGAAKSGEARASAPLVQQDYDRQQHDAEEGRSVDRHLSLTEQVQKAASAKQSPAIQPWAKLPESIPPQSSSPLPAPAARRGGPSLAESLAVEPMPQSQTPSIETPTAATSLAPWASQQQETHKQPSLKEIQEAEGRRAARQEQIASAARRAAVEREAASQPPPPAPGLPSSSTWGNIESPTTPSASTTSAWAKSAAKPAAVPAGTKKTLQQIQQEEEAAAKKKRAQAASNATIPSAVTGAATVSASKRYAELAGKVTPPTAAPAGVSAWTTVGASGKTKPNAVPVPAVASRSTSTSATVVNSVSQVKKPVAAAPKTSLANVQQQAQEEFKKWAIAELRPDLNKDISVDEFVHTLLSFPADTDILTEVVHQNSRTMDSRHFAEEFVRRRGLADKGKMEAAATRADHAGEGKSGGGGWSEVARKGSVPGAAPQQKEEGNAFKIVAAKKKSGKK